MNNNLKHKIALLLSAFFKSYFKLRYGKKISWGKNVIVNHKFKFGGKGKLIIGDEVNLWAHKEPNEFFTYSTEARIKIGSRTRVNGIGVQCRKSVVIGADCLIGSAVIMDNDFHSIHFEYRNDPQYIKSAEVIIGDRAWLAGQCAILKGVTIGEEAVVGFRAVVSQNVAPKTVMAGNPAMVVKKIELQDAVAQQSIGSK